MKKVLGKSFLFGVLSCISISSAYSANPGAMTVDVSRFEVTAVDTPSITKGHSGVQTATITNFGPSAATGTVAEVRGATTTGVTITGVTWGAADTVCPLTGTVYSCSVGGLSVGSTFDVKITYAVAQTATTSTSVQQTTLAVKSNQANLGSGAGESIHRVWGREGSSTSAPSAYDAFWVGRTANGTCTVNRNSNGVITSTTCGTYSWEGTSLIGAWPLAEKNPIGQYLRTAASNSELGDTYYFVSSANKPEPTFVDLVTNLIGYTNSQVTLAEPSNKRNSYTNNLRAWEFETYVYIPNGTSEVNACVGTQGSHIDDGAYITIQKSNNGVLTNSALMSNSRESVRDSWDSDNPYVVSSTLTTGGYYKITYRMVNQNSINKYAQGLYGPIGMSFSGGTCSNTELQKLLETGFPTTITVLDKADLAITKTVDKATVKVGDLLTYKLKVWNKGVAAVTGAIVTDNVPADLASVQVVCKAVGTATCPASISNINNSNSRSITLGLLPLVGKDSNNNDANYLEFTLTGLLYKEPSGTSVSNTATIALPAGLTDTDPTNNTSTVSTVVTKNTPITNGESENMCVSAQSVNLITDTKFYSYIDNSILSSQGFAVNPAISPYSVAYGTGANGALQLQGKINWSYGNPRVTGSTLKIYVNGTPYAVLTTPGASVNNDATFTALNGATVTPVSFTVGQYNTAPSAVNFTVTLPTTVVSSLSTLNVDFQNISPNKSANDAGDDIGFSLNNLNVCLKPTFELKKISEGGTDAFEFENFSNLAANASYQIQSGEVVTTVVGSAQNVRLKNSVSPVENGFTSPVYADANKAISFTEKESGLYSLRSVECTDSNSTVSGNVAGNLAVRQGSTVTLDASKVKFASKLICKVTNEKKAGYVFSGRVINDNSGTTQDAAKAYNGVADSGEVGIAGSRIELQNCSTKEVFASAQTNANGGFEIRTLQNVFDATSNNVCLVQKNVDGYTSVSSAKSASVTAVVDAGHDLFTVEKNGTASVYDGFLFGDAQLQLILTQNGQKNISAGDVVDYPHEIISNSVHKLGALTSSNIQQPSGQDWQSMIYHDTNCNGLVDVNEKLYSAALQNTQIMPGQKICLVQRVVSSAAAKAGDSLTAEFKLDYSQNYEGNTPGKSNSVHDITTVGSAGLDIKKQVRTVNACPSTSADTALFTTENTAKKEQFLEYQIAYTNSSAKKLIDVVLKDSVPLGTEYKTCTENCTQTGSSLTWDIPGTLLPGARGNVLFCVKVQ